MTIKSVTRWQTSDGNLHTNLQAAENWEAILKTVKHEADVTPEYNYRSQGEDNHVDRYFGRGC